MNNGSLAQTPQSRRLGWRIGALIICLTGALVATLVWKHSQAPRQPAPGTAAARPAELPVDQILAAIPVPAEDSAIDRNSACAHGIIGDAALELGDYNKAFAEYKKMIGLRPDLLSWSRSSYLFWLTGNRSKAMWLMQRAIKAGAPEAENTAWCRAKLALMLFEDGAYEPAAQVLKPALGAGSRNIHVLLAAGRIAAAGHDFPAAMRYYETVLERSPNHEALAALGDLQATAGEKAKAAEYYKKVETLHVAHLVNGVPDDMWMAKFYADHDRNLREALRLTEKRKLTRNVLEADIVAWVSFKNGDLRHAGEAMRRALRWQTPAAEMHYHAGMIAAASGDRGAAQKELGQALSLNPKFSLLQGPVAVLKLAEMSGRAAATTELPQRATGR